MADATTINPRVIDLICSRICHDLISPVSAINNGIELMGDSGEGMDGDAFSLIADSATIVAGRLAVMRYAYGAATPSLDEVRAIVMDYFTDSKIQLTWPKTGLATDLASKQNFPKVVLNIILTLAEAIGAAGSITLESSNSGELTITGESKAGTVRADVLAGFELATDMLDARTIQAYTTGMLAARFGFRLVKTVTDSKIVFSLR
jgi:histidine phosphotransferase ChpT